jgi:integron integrase
MLAVPKLLAKVRQEIRSKHLSYRTEKAYLDWIYRYFTFHDKKDPEQLNEKDITTFLSFHAVKKQVAASTQHQALYAILFLYRHVLKQSLRKIEFIKSQSKNYSPEILSRDEIKLILEKLKGEKWLMVSLLYGCGLSLNECLSLRIKDIDFDKEEIAIHDSRGEQRRIVALPKNLKNVLQKRMESLKYKYMLRSLKDCQNVYIPPGLEKLYPEASRTFQWFFLFPASEPTKDRQTKHIRWHHRSDTYIQKSIKKSLISTGINKHVSCQTFRHSYAIHLLEEGYDIRAVQQWLGHKNIRNTMVYRRLIHRKIVSPKSPLDTFF